MSGIVKNLTRKELNHVLLELYKEELFAENYQVSLQANLGSMQRNYTTMLNSLTSSYNNLVLAEAQREAMYNLLYMQGWNLYNKGMAAYSDWQNAINYVAELKTRKSTIDSDLANARTQKTNAETAYANAVTYWENTLAAKAQQIADKQAQINSTNATIAGINAQIADIDSQIANVNERRAALSDLAAQVTDTRGFINDMSSVTNYSNLYVISQTMLDSGWTNENVTTTGSYDLVTVAFSEAARYGGIYTNGSSVNVGLLTNVKSWIMDKLYDIRSSIFDYLEDYTTEELESDKAELQSRLAYYTSRLNEYTAELNTLNAEYANLQSQRDSDLAQKQSDINYWTNQIASLEYQRENIDKIITSAEAEEVAKKEAYDSIKESYEEFTDKHPKDEKTQEEYPSLP